MTAYILRRLAQAVPTVLFSSRAPVPPHRCAPGIAPHRDIRRDFTIHFPNEVLPAAFA
jgi:hypothetical protein